VNKAELIAQIAERAKLTNTDAAQALDAMINAVTKALKKGDSVTLVGFGTARTGRNPRTGETIKIKAAKVPKFRPGKGLKDALN
jgi:DNA-binding protein HU-beta